MSANLKTRDLLVFISSKGCPNCVRIDNNAFKNKLKNIASKYNKDYLYISLKANNSKLTDEHPELPTTLGLFTWFFPLFLLIDKDQWNNNNIIDPYIMDGRVEHNGKVTAIQTLPYPLNLTGVDNWLKDIKSGKITNKIDFPDKKVIKKDTSVPNEPKSDNTNSKIEPTIYSASASFDDSSSYGPFMNDSKIDSETHFCSCTIQPKNRAYRVKS